MSAALQQLNALPAAAAHAALLRCCGASRWAAAMVQHRPYQDETALLQAAEAAFAPLGRADWLEAFRAHPQIGAMSAAARAGKWSQEEQAGVQGADAQVLTSLARLNQVYLDRFGFIFLVCATGKSAAEMLSLLEARLAHDAATELGVAAEEQKKITRIRLRKLLET